jgi:hypothetical protein
VSRERYLVIHSKPPAHVFRNKYGKPKQRKKRYGGKKKKSK